LKKQLGIVSVVTLLVASLFTLTALASDAQMYFSSDKNGASRVTNIQEGDEVFIVVIDNDQNLDCDVRDKIWADIKIMDPKTGAYIVWGDATDGSVDDDGVYILGSNGQLGDDYLEETGPDTGVFVSDRSFQVGTRESYAAGNPNWFAHVVDRPDGRGLTDDFQWGHYTYMDFDADGFADDRAWLAAGPVWNDATLALTALGVAADLPSDWVVGANPYVIGRFENMDTLVGAYVDPNDATDVAIALMKIFDYEAQISWGQEIYKDANGSATITVTDLDENLNCNEIEYVPVFILVNPGSWNPWDVPRISPTNFCQLLRQGGVTDTLVPLATVQGQAVRWYNIYDSDLTEAGVNLALDTVAGVTPQPDEDGTRYIQYPNGANGHDGRGSVFNTSTVSGTTRIQFYAQETGVNTGVFQLNLNSLLVDLGFQELFVRDVLVAYYLDPNDFDDFKLATAYIEERQHSITNFTDATRADQDLFWLGRDAVYVQVIDANANVDPCCPEQVVVHICDPHGEDDAEWLILDEVSSNSPVFFTNAGTQLWPVWDALGVGDSNAKGGFQLVLDNWKIEAFNEDSVYARYNDVYYFPNESVAAANDGLAFLGDQNVLTAFPPQIQRIRVANDVSFDTFEVADTQVYNGDTVNMWFLDRSGNVVSGFVNSDCVFIKVLDPDQDEDQYRRERIDGFWDKSDVAPLTNGQNLPFGPDDFAVNRPAGLCEFADVAFNPVNVILGDTNMFGPRGAAADRWAKLYVLNPRNGRWAPVDLLETGVATGEFVSVICIDLTSVYDCVPSLGILPGDTIIAVYQDPSNHSDSAWISIKVGIGGGGTPPSQASTTMFVDSTGAEVANYMDADLAYVKVIDPSHAGAALLANAVDIDGATYDLVPLVGAASDTFITAGLDLGFAAGDTITATYTDPTDPTDVSDDTITVIASELAVTGFYASPNPFETDVEFGFDGTGIATVMSVAIYDLSGALVWAEELANVTGIVWNGTDEGGAMLANGGYIYVIMATDGTNTFNGEGLVFINR